MRIVNQTRWCTKDIQRLIRRVAEDELDPGQLKQARVTVKYQRKGQPKMGECHLNTARNPSIYMILLLPRQAPINMAAYALIIAHELAHARGLQEREVRRSNRYWWLEGWQERYAYALHFSMQEQVPVAADPLSHAQTMVSKWSQAAKRAETYLKKWRLRLQAAERRNRTALLETSPIRQPLPALPPQVDFASAPLPHGASSPSPLSATLQ